MEHRKYKPRVKAKLDFFYSTVLTQKPINSPLAFGGPCLMPTQESVARPAFKCVVLLQGPNST